MSVLLKGASVLAVTAALVVGCATGPSTREELCAGYDELGTAMLKGNGLFDNAVFRAADELGDLAERYEQADLSADARLLHSIGDSSRTDGGTLMHATSGTARVCGYPLGVKALLGGLR